MLFFIIFFLSIIQSIFGIGLLIIGTPLLLLLNLDFIKILSILLPCSILISFLQIVFSKFKINNYQKKIIYLSIPAVIAGIIMLHFVVTKINFKIFIGCSILLMFLFKFIITKKFFKKIFIKYKKITIIFIGLFHGLTNVGGTLLSLFFQEINSNNKNKIQASVSYAYFFFALTQYLSIQIFFKNIYPNIENLYLLFASILGFLLGKKIFSKIKDDLFIKILNLLILISASILIFS